MFVHKMWEEGRAVKNGGSRRNTISHVVLMAVERLGRYMVYMMRMPVWMSGAVFLIDPDGVVQAFEMLSPPVGRNVSETIRQIQAFQLVRETKGAEATPSGWKPGKVTLKPGPGLVGNVWKEWKTEMAFD